MGRPKTPIGAYGAINFRRRGRSMVAETGVHDQDGRLRQIRVAGPTAAAARQRLRERLADRPEQNGGKSLRRSNSFADLTKLWLADLELRDLADGTRQNYRDTLRLHVLSAFEHYTLAEITTGRVPVLGETASRQPMLDSVTRDLEELASDTLGSMPETITADVGPKLLRFWPGEKSDVADGDLEPFEWFSTEKLLHDKVAASPASRGLSPTRSVGSSSVRTTPGRR